MTRIVEKVRGYENSGNRKRAIAQLRKRGWNYFVCFLEKTSDYALLYAKAQWVTDERGPNGVYVDW